jgi:hypothetical protein
MNIQDIVWLIFNRWLQENDFKYLDVHFGINQLDSRSSFDFKEISHNYNDRKTETAEYKQIKKQTQQINNALAKNLLKINRKTSSIEKKKLKQEQLQLAIKNNFTGAKGFLKELKKINKSITAMQKDLKKLNSAREIYERDLEIAEYNQTQAIKKDSRIQQLLQENYRLLDTRRKSYMDALRINAANIFRNLHADYREIYNNYRDDHHYLRVLTRCSGSVEYDKTGLIISLWLPGSMQKHIIQPLDKLVQLVSAKFNENLESDKITIKLVTGVIRP